MNERIAVLGASRGLGAAFVKEARLAIKDAEWWLASRKEKQLSALASQFEGRAQFFCADFSKTQDQESCLRELKTFAPTRIFYFAGGGPHGFFQSANMSDHRWAWEVSFAFPATVVHAALASIPEVRQIILTGSAVAEDAADPKAASYAAAKHALRGLVRSVRAEKPAVDLRLYSPGYMDTDLLSPNAWPRQQGLAVDASLVAQDLLSWIFKHDDHGFRIYK